MALHRAFIPDLEHAAPGQTIRILGDEAQHAIRVKRLELGQRLAVLNGRGLVVIGRVASTGKERGDWVMDVAVDAIETEPRTTPRIEVRSAVPKGPRLADLVDQLAQAGADAWGPLDTIRAAAEPRESKLERLERVAHEASKQSGRAWTMDILPPMPFADALRPSDAAPRVILADASGPPYAATGAKALRLLVGPEGGWDPRELAAAHDAGCTIASFGPHVLRIETAAVVACAIVLDLERRH